MLIKGNAIATFEVQYIYIVGCPKVHRLIEGFTNRTIITQRNLKASEIYTIEDLKSRVSTLRDTVDDLKATMDMETARMKEMRKMPEYVAILQELKPIVDGLQKIKFDKAKAKYKAEHEKELKRYYAARRKVLDMFPDGKYDSRILNKQYDEFEQTHKETYEKFVAIRDEYQRIWHIQSCVNKGLGNTEHPREKKDNRKQEER